MKFWIVISIQFINILSFAQIGDVFEKFKPIKFKENISLNGYTIKQTYKLSEGDFILIARPLIYNQNDEGLRLIYLNQVEGRYKVKYISSGAGESYIYNPTFFRNKDKILIICDLGSEYSWGLDVFLFSKAEMQKLGKMDVAVEIDGGEQQESATPLLMIEDYDSRIIFSFKPQSMYESIQIDKLRLFYKPGNLDERANLDEIFFTYSKDGWKLNRKSIK